MNNVITRVLVCDVRLCKSCGHCDKIANFKTIHKGCIMLTSCSEGREEVRQAINSLVTGCPHGAISYE